MQDTCPSPVDKHTSFIRSACRCLCLCRQLDWRPEKQGDLRKRHEKVVIIRNMFHPSDFEVPKQTFSFMPLACLQVSPPPSLFSQEDPLVLNEYRDDLRTECERFGTVKKVILFDVSAGQQRVYFWRSNRCFEPLCICVLQRHPDGVASVAFKETEEADACIQSFNGRWFGGRQLSAQLWDGVTDYQVNPETKTDGWRVLVTPHRRNKYIMVYVETVCFKVIWKWTKA